MITLTTLASGSSGNSLLLSSGSTHILVDAEMCIRDSPLAHVNRVSSVHTVSLPVPNHLSSRTGLYGLVRRT